MITFITDEYVIDLLGIAYLSAMLKESGYHAKLVLTSEIKNTVIDTPIVAYSVTTGKHRHYVEVNRWVKEKYPNIISIFGGPHCTFFPDFAKEYGIDFIFRGEGFEAIVQFCDRYIKDKGMNTESIYKTPNIAYLYDEEILKINPLLPAIKVAELPFPDRQLIYQFKKNRENPIRNVMASFGCPMQCSYCYNKQFKKLGYQVRARQVESVIEECEKLIKDYPNTALIYFQDDIFPVYRTDWLQAFCDEYKKRVKTPFHIQVRIEMLNSDRVQHLKSAGLHGVTFAIETADETARMNLLGRYFPPFSIPQPPLRKGGTEGVGGFLCSPFVKGVGGFNNFLLSGAKLLHQHGIKFRIENMLGIPGETLESALRTLDLNIKCHPDVGWASLFAPYPGTDLGDYCQQIGLIEGDFDADFFTRATLKLKDKKQIERLQKLFGLICAVPQLRPLAPLLTKLPLSYKGVYKWVKKWLYEKKLYKREV